MIAIKASQDKVLAVLMSVAGIVERRHTLPILVFRNAITNGFPEQGGGGASADADCAGAADGAAPEVAQDDDDGDGDGDPDSDRHRPPHPSPRALLCNAAIPAGAKPNPSSSADCELWRLPVVLQKIPVSKSGWFAGVRAGRYPKPVKLGARAVAWRAVDIRALVASL